MEANHTPGSLSDQAKLLEAADRFDAAAIWLRHAAAGDADRNLAVSTADGLVRAGWSFLEGPEAA